MTYLLRVICYIITSMQKTVYTYLAYKFVRRYQQTVIKIKENSENIKKAICENLLRILTLLETFFNMKLRTVADTNTAGSIE